VAAGSDTYELFAIRYATREGSRRDNFIGGDPHDGPMRMDYFIWVAIGSTRCVVIDTGFTAEMAEKRRREFLRCPVDSLNLLGLDPATITDIILTHLHYDHVGNFHRFPKATFHLQDRELSCATGRYMRHPFCAHAYEVEDVVGIVRLNYQQRVEFHDGDAEFAPGITLHLAGGHALGLQYVRIHTARGWVILASDVAHYYENITSGRPFITTMHVGDTLEGYHKIMRHAPSVDHIVPGHDPLVMKLYPAPRPELENAIVRLDVMPRKHAL
jgi:glyoxylase-like metal-dependent hydrolase (beta-lactamase superfamily II)